MVGPFPTHHGRLGGEPHLVVVVVVDTHIKVAVVDEVAVVGGGVALVVGITITTAVGTILMRM